MSCGGADSRVSFHTLQLFRDIVASKSITKGAELSGVTASAASQHLQELERTLGVMLLDRSTRPFTLTESGRLYNETCRDILRRWEGFVQSIDHVKGRTEGEVRVASIYSVGLSEMSLLQAELARRAPDVELAVDYLRPEKVYEAVAEERADLGLVSYPEPQRELAVIPWREEEMVVAASVNHPLSTLASIQPSDLEGMDFVAFDEDLPIRHNVDRYLRQHGVEVRIALHFDNLQMIKEAVVHGSGVSIVPERILRAELEQHRLRAIPLAQPLYRPLGIIHRKKKRFNRAAQVFLEVLQQSSVHELVAG